MLSRKSAGSVLFLSLLMFCGAAAADEAGGGKRAEETLAGTNFDLTLSPSWAVGGERELTDGMRFSESWSQPGSWRLSILAHGMESYVLTAVVTDTGGSGFTGVSLESTTATREGYFGSPVVLANNPVPTSFVKELSTANFMFTGILFVVGLVRCRGLSRERWGRPRALFLRLSSRRFLRPPAPGQIFASGKI